MIVDQVKINNHLWRIEYSSEGHYIGVCDELKVTMSGDTEGELFENIVHVTALINENGKNP